MEGKGYKRICPRGSEVTPDEKLIGLPMGSSSKLIGRARNCTVVTKNNNS